MKFFSVLFFAALLAGISQASPIDAEVDSAAIGGCTCGSNSYSAAALGRAITKARTGGAFSYPHSFRNSERISFPGCTSYNEYPLKPTSVYKGGPPGPDRVIYDNRGNLCGCVTHTGSVGNTFIRCN